jgi:ABC-type multidrug transport system ATPase subunit
MLLTLYGIGTYKGFTDVLEYYYLISPDANRELVQVDNRVINNITWVSDNVANVSLTDTWDYLGDGGHDKFVAPTNERITFQPCSSVVDFEEVWSSGGFDFLKDKALNKMTPMNLCTAVVNNCYGGLFPYKSVNDCLNFIGQLPLTCNDGQHTLQGNTTSCRFLHAVAAGISPVVHCQHTGPDSMKCYDQGEGSCEAGKYAGKTPLDFGDAKVPSEWPTATFALEMTFSFIFVTVPAIYFIVSYFLGSHVLRHEVKKARREQRGANLAVRKLSTLRFDKLTLCARDVVYVRGSKPALNGVSLLVQSGHLSAVLGTSGAGKSTLFNLLSARGTGTLVAGDIRIIQEDGFVTPEEAGTQVALVPQDAGPLASAMPELTVMEAVILAALSTPPRGTERSAEAANTLAKDSLIEMGLESAANTHLSKLSGGQLKRCSIAFCLVSCPGLLLVDEPTSGLDSSSALNVMLSLRALADTGRAVLVSVHQPRSSIMDLIDNCMLLKAGGKPIYFGPPSALKVILEQREREMKTVLGNFPAASDHNGFWTRNAASVFLSVFDELDLAQTGHLNSSELEIFTTERGWTPEEVAALTAWGDTKYPAGFTLADFESLVKDAAVRSHTELPMSHVQFELLMERATGSDQGTLLMFRAFLEARKAHADRLGGEVGEGALPAVASGDSAADAMSDWCDRSNLDLKANNDLKLDENLVHSSIEWPSFDGLKSTGANNSSTVMATLKSNPAKKGASGLQAAAAARTIHGSPWMDLLAFPLGCLLIGCLVGLLFPQLEMSSVQQLYLFPASLLVALAAVTNLAVFNQSGILLRRELPLLKEQFHTGYLSSAGLVWQLACRSCFLNWCGALLFFPTIYFLIGFNNGAVDFVRMAMSFISLLLFMSLCMAISDACNFFFSSTTTALITGLWLSWLSLFAGVLIQVDNMFVIFKPWAAYVSPMYHTINTWLYETMYRKQTQCKPRELPLLCPPSGSDALTAVGYGQLTGNASQGAMLIMLIGYYAVFWLCLVWSKRSRSKKTSIAPANGTPSSTEKNDILVEYTPEDKAAVSV